MTSETILVVGASGKIGISVIIAALWHKLNVLAIVRNQAAAEKIFRYVGTKDGITIVEADVTSEYGVQQVVDRVKTGILPSFQHVYSAVGGTGATTPIQNVDVENFRRVMNVNFESNLLAYRSTIPYLISQNNPKSTWTLITGGYGDLGLGGAISVSQGANFSLANVACYENEKTNIRFNEVYLLYRVDFDGTGDFIKVADFARVYEGILGNKEIRGSRVSIYGPEDVDELKYRKKLDLDSPWYKE